MQQKLPACKDMFLILKTHIEINEGGAAVEYAEDNGNDKRESEIN